MIQPLTDRIIIKRIEDQERIYSGLIVPQIAQQKPLEGVVVAVGKGTRGKRGERKPLGVEVGERVLFGKYTGQEIEYDGEKVLVMRESEILGIVQLEKGVAA